MRRKNAPWRNNPGLQAAVGKQDGSGGHTRLRFFLQKGLAVMLLQEPFRLPCAKPQLSGQLL